MENKSENVHARKQRSEGTQDGEPGPLLERRRCEFQSRSVLIATFQVTSQPVQRKLPTRQSGIFTPATYHTGPRHQSERHN